MTPLSICIIDDRIPVERGEAMITTQCLNASNLNLLLKNEEHWKGEEKLKDLIGILLKDTTNWQVCAFKHPQFYLDYSENEQYCPDIIILDWDLNDVDEPTENFLKKILKRSFAIISIFSGCDKMDEIEGIISQPEFAEFKNFRIRQEDKNSEDSHRNLLVEASKLYQDNFSFKFGKELRKKTAEAVEDILIELGKMPINVVQNLLHNTDEPKEEELRVIISERLKSNLKEDGDLTRLLEKEGISAEVCDQLIELVAQKLKENLPALTTKAITRTTEPNDADTEIQKKILKRLWAYRLYHKPSDKRVRRGDIVKKHDTDGILYLIVSANCDLAKFWHKNFGYLNILPIYKIAEGSSGIIEKITLTRTIEKCRNVTTRFNPTSITNNIGELPDGPLILPVIEEEGSFANYIAFPKELISEKIEKPTGITNLKNTSLIYNHLTNFDGSNRIAISEPFLTPIIEHIISAITSHGTPDYPQIFQKFIEDDLRSIFR